jgi:4-hydroxybenzoate polyprenyltransferase
MSNALGLEGDAISSKGGCMQPIQAETVVQVTDNNRQILPLVIDLDGTLLLGDLLFEAAATYVRQNPLHLFLLFWWGCQGLAHLKSELSLRVVPAIDHAPFNAALVEYAQSEKLAGRRVVLATASPATWGHAVATRFTFIDDVFGSCSQVNLKGRRKADMLEQRFGCDYVYAGDAKCDVEIWNRSNGAIYAGRNAALEKRIIASPDISLEANFSRRSAGIGDWLRSFRLHQWAKNLLIFAPMLLAGDLANVNHWAISLVGFLAMGLTASATYMLNDIFDLADDRRHWKKRHRPLAAGIISIPQAVSAACLMMMFAFISIGYAAGWGAVVALAIYSVVSGTYSFGLKRVPVVDVLVLAGLFTLRLVFGAGLVHTPVSDWLLVFSMLIFLSLALAKRATELARHQQIEGGAAQLSGRGYEAKDIALVTGLGTAAALAAPVIMALYLINEAFSKDVYNYPKFLWFVPVLIGLWLGRMWLLCGRGQMADDPVSFALKDRASVAVGASVCGAMMLAIAPWH